MWGDWRDAYVHGTLVIWPPDDVRAVVNPLRERYDTASARICEAHITLTQPFVRAPDDSTWATVEQVAASVQPIEIRYGGLDTFLPYPCLYVAIEPNESLTALHEALQQTGLFQPVPAHHERYVPHMTILEGSMDVDDVARLADQLGQVAPAGSFTCDAVAYVVPDESFRFSVRRRFSLSR
jgi:2'-5' RNA ligase